MADWLPGGLEEDMRRRMFAATAAGEAFALATIAAADGGPRPVGSQMVVTGEQSSGFLSGGCIEADVALHARQVLADGEPRTLVYGRGSPFIDLRLPCGGRLEVLVERVLAGDPAVTELKSLTEARTVAWWQSNGRERWCGPANGPQAALPGADVIRPYSPFQRLAVVGTDPFAVAIATLGRQMGWEANLLAPFAGSSPPPFDLPCDRRPLLSAFADLAPDPWTAIAVATHEIEADEEVLVHALRSDAGYVGVLGSRRRLPERLARLRRAGLSEAQIGRLKAPIGLPIAARSPWEVAVAVTGEIIAAAHEANAAELASNEIPVRAAARR